jgi:hypothetical protein
MLYHHSSHLDLFFTSVFFGNKQFCHYSLGCFCNFIQIICDKRIDKLLTYIIVDFGFIRSMAPHSLYFTVPISVHSTHFLSSSAKLLKVMAVTFAEFCAY